MVCSLGRWLLWLDIETLVAMQLLYHLLLQAQEVERFKRQQAQAAADVLKQQMEAKKEANARTKELFANKVTEDYYAQFGTSHR
jgi:hypothetical protein